VELLRRLAISTAINIVALVVVAVAFSDVHIDGWGALILAGIVFGLVNTFIKPIVKFLALPLVVLTFGIALFFVNMLMLALTDWIVNGLVVDGFWTLVGATLVVWLVNLVLDTAFGVRNWGKRRR
jgi:putative membrane protein